MSTDTSNQPTSDESSAPDDEILMLRRRRRKEAVPGGLNLVHAGGGAGLFSAIVGGWASGALGSDTVTVAVRD